MLCLIISSISCRERPRAGGKEVNAEEVSLKHQLVDAAGVVNPWAKLIADMDGDGSPDVIIGGQNGPLVWYRNPDWAKFIIADGGYDTVDGEAGDVDGDGDMDIVMGGLLWYENPGNAVTNQDALWRAHRIAEHPTHDVELADINGDGLLDVVTRNQSDFGTMKGNTIHLWTNRGQGIWEEEILDCDHGEGLSVTDLDGDDDIDVVGTGFWFENLGNNRWERHDFVKWHGSANLSVEDLNDDRRLDIILTPSELAGQYYRISWFEQPEDASQGRWAEHVLMDSIECVIHGVGTGDFNGDHQVDIAYSEMHQGADPDEVVILLNKGRGSDWKKLILSEKGSHSIEVADINGDGHPDILGANWSGQYQPVELWLSGNN